MIIKIFLITSNKADLKNRLTKRNQDSPEQLEKRLKAFDGDVKHWKDYDYVVINKNLGNCFKQIEKIISLTKCKFILKKIKFVKISNVIKNNVSEESKLS